MWIIILSILFPALFETAARSIYVIICAIKWIYAKYNDPLQVDILESGSFDSSDSSNEPGSSDYTDASFDLSEQSSDCTDIHNDPEFNMNMINAINNAFDRSDMLNYFIKNLNEPKLIITDEKNVIYVAVSTEENVREIRSRFIPEKDILTQLFIYCVMSQPAALNYDQRANLFVKAVRESIDFDAHGLWSLEVLFDAENILKPLTKPADISIAYRDTLLS